jgi:hypothetical protein
MMHPVDTLPEKILVSLACNYFCKEICSFAFAAIFPFFETILVEEIEEVIEETGKRP